MPQLDLKVGFKIWDESFPVKVSLARNPLEATRCSWRWPGRAAAKGETDFFWGKMCVSWGEQQNPPRWQLRSSSGKPPSWWDWLCALFPQELMKEKSDWCTRKEMHICLVAELGKQARITEVYYLCDTSLLQIQCVDGFHPKQQVRWWTCAVEWDFGEHRQPFILRTFKQRLLSDGRGRSTQSCCSFLWPEILWEILEMVWGELSFSNTIPKWLGEPQVPGVGFYCSWGRYHCHQGRGRVSSVFGWFLKIFKVGKTHLDNWSS